MYNHAKTVKIYPVDLNKTPIAGRIGIRASRSSPIRTPKSISKKRDCENIPRRLNKKQIAGMTLGAAPSLGR